MHVVRHLNTTGVNSITNTLVTLCWRILGSLGRRFFVDFDVIPLQWNEPLYLMKKNRPFAYGYCIQNPCTRIDPVLNKIFPQCLRTCLIFHSYTSGNPIVSYKREGDSTDGWTSSTSLGSSTAGDTFDWGSATSFTESREYAINVQLDPGVSVYFMSYIKRQLKKKLQDTRSWN